MKIVNIKYLMRLPYEGCWSLERVYSDIWPYFSKRINVGFYTCHYESRGLWRRLAITVAAAFNQGDINHVTGDVHFLTYFLKKKFTVLTILDCVVLERLKGIKRWIFWFFWYAIPEKCCTHIIVISESTRKQVLDTLKCKPDKVSVIYCPVSPMFKQKFNAFNTKKPRVLHIGATENKNLNRHVSALVGIPCELIVVGNFSEVQIDMLQKSGVDYKAYKNLSEFEILTQYQQADILLFASTYEGFGMPIAEAQAVGRVVVTSNLWSMPEVAGDGACLVDPYDVESIRTGLDCVINNKEYREDLVRRGFENVKRFNVEKIALDYENLYFKVINN